MPPLKSLLCFFLFTKILFPASEELVVYTYSSLSGKGSLSERLQKEWEKTGKKVRFVSFSTSGESLNQVMLEKEKTKADLVLGMDQQGWVKAKTSGYFLSKDYSKIFSGVSKNIPNELLKSGFVPFDYGYLAFVFDKTKTKPHSPTPFSQFLADNQKSKNLILIDPRTSQLGFSLLAWTKFLWKGETWEKNVKLLAQEAKLWAPGWSAAYSLFLKKEGEYVLSYTTSPAYHLEEEKKTQYDTVVFSEGQWVQTETAAIVKSTLKRELAEDFLKLLLSKSIQEQIPRLQWMYPVIEGVKLPESFQKIQVTKPLTSFVEDEKTFHSWINSWTELIVAPK